MVKSKELSSKPIVYGSRIFNEENNILLGLENWKGVLLDKNLDILEEKTLCEEGDHGALKSVELGADRSFFGFKNGHIQSVKNEPSTNSSVRTCS